MKRLLPAIILLTILLTACAPSQETSGTLPLKETEEKIETNTIVPTQIPENTSTPAPTLEPTPTSTPDLGQQPYFTDFSSVSD